MAKWQWRNGVIESNENGIEKAKMKMASSAWRHRRKWRNGSINNGENENNGSGRHGVMASARNNHNDE
jgi:hypothetical protein